MNRLEEIKNMDFDSTFDGEDFEWLISEIERLRKNWKKYGGHLRWCDVFETNATYCNCGFEQALKEG